jgi:hypothetical protein
VTEHAGGVRRAVGLARRIDPLEIDVARVRVDVRIDHAGHQRAAADVDNLCVACLDRLVGNFGDQSVAKQDVPILRTFGVDTVEDTCIAE